MNSHSLRFTVIAAVFGIVMIAGCSSNKTPAETPAAGSQPAPGVAAPSPGQSQGESAESITPAETVPAIWIQIDAEQAKLAATIETGQLKDVHHLAFGIRDLVVALADKASAATPASADRLKHIVEEVRASAASLDELGDAGNLSGTQAEFAKMTAILSAVKAIAGA